MLLFYINFCPGIISEQRLTLICACTGSILSDMLEDDNCIQSPDVLTDQERNLSDF